MLNIVLPLLLSFIFALVLERADAISEAMVGFAVKSLPPSMREGRANQWLVDVREVEGRAWKLLTALGILWTCKCDVAEKLLGIKLPRRYAVVCIPADDGPYIIMFEKKNINPCALVVFGVLMDQVEEHLGEDRARQLMKSSLEEASSTDCREWVESEHAFFTHVAPADVDILLKVVDGKIIPETQNADE